MAGQFVIYFCCLAALSFGLIYMSAYTEYGHQYVAPCAHSPFTCPFTW